MGGPFRRASLTPPPLQTRATLLCHVTSWLVVLVMSMLQEAVPTSQYDSSNVAVLVETAAISLPQSLLHQGPATTYFLLLLAWI